MFPESGKGTAAEARIDIAVDDLRTA